MSEEGREQGGGSKGGEKTSREVSRGGHSPVYASGGGIEQGRGAREEGEQGMGENVKGGIQTRAQASVQYIHKPIHNAAFGLETLVLQLKNSEQV